MPALTTLPKMASEMVTPGESLASAPLMAIEANSEPLRLEKEPRNLPMGVRATLAMTMLVDDMATGVFSERSQDWKKLKGWLTSLCLTRLDESGNQISIRTNDQ
jgi:hypothetical protein